MRKPSLALVLSLTLTLMMMEPMTAIATGKGPCSEARYEVTRSTPGDVRERKMKALIRCAFTRFGESDEVSTAIAIATRESGLRPWATNPVSAGVCRPYSETVFGSCGMFQHLARYWGGRVTAHLRERWFPRTWPHVPVLQARANVMVAARIVASRGWCDWTPPNYCA